MIETDFDNNLCCICLKRPTVAVGDTYYCALHFLKEYGPIKIPIKETGE